MKKTLALFSLFACALAQAQGQPSPTPAALQPMVEQAGLKVVKKFDTKTALDGWVVEDANKRQAIVFTTKDGKTVVVGKVFDSSGNNLTERFAEQQLSKPDFGKFAPAFTKLPVVQEGATGSAVKKSIYVFTDPNCPYCHATWQALKPLYEQGLQVNWIYVGILGESSMGKAAAILEAANPAEAHVKHNEQFEATRGVTPVTPSASSKEILKKNMALMRDMGLNGTPAILYKDAAGAWRASPGMPNAQQLQAIMR